MTTQNEQQAGAQGLWVFDPYHTQVEFAAKHLGMMTVRGNFLEIAATGFIDPEHPESSAVDVTIQTASIRTHNETRDNDLRSSNFLEVDKYPTITFKSTKIEPAGQRIGTVVGQPTAGPVVAHRGLRPGVPGEQLRPAHVAVGLREVQGDGGVAQRVRGEPVRDGQCGRPGRKTKHECWHSLVW